MPLFGIFDCICRNNLGDPDATTKKGPLYPLIQSKTMSDGLKNITRIHGRCQSRALHLELRKQVQERNFNTEGGSESGV